MGTAKSKATEYRANAEQAVKMSCQLRDKAVQAQMQAEQDAEDFVGNKKLHREEGLDRPYGKVTQDSVYATMAVAKDALGGNRWEISKAVMYATQADMWASQALMWLKMLEMELAQLARLADPPRHR